MNLNTLQISQCIANKDYLTAEQAITDFIRSNTHANDTLDIPVKNAPLEASSIDPEQVYYNFCDQFSTLITQLFSAPSYRPSITTINTFFTCKFIIEWLFSASLWKNTDGLIEHLQLIQTDRFGNLKLNEKRLTLLLMLITLSSKFQLPWKVLFKAMPSQALSAYIGLITQPIPATSKESNAGFNYLLESAKDLPVFDLPVVEDLGKLNYPFFACSYATSPDKYEFKKWLTKLIRHNLKQWLSPIVKQYINDMPNFQQKAKLKMIVMLEQYSSNHAMHRCFNSRLQSLAKDYELIAVIDENSLNDEALSLFDKVLTIKNVFDINENAELVLQEKPDVVFYPSIGMNFWGIYLSQLRLAPRQLMMGGHPSSSYSPEIDCFMVPGNTFTAEALQPFISEKVIMVDEKTNEIGALTMHEDIDDAFLDSHNHFIEDEQEIKIAINGVLTKVTYAIIDVCKRIQDNTKKKVTFYFYCTYHKNQLSYLSSKKQLSRMLKSFELIHFSSYRKYMASISECHFLLPTLPFGGSNSNIDAALLNKPKLFLKGDSHLYTYTDEASWDRLNLVNELGVSSVNELINKSIQLVENKAQRKELFELMVRNCDLKNIYKNNEADDSTNKIFNVALEVS